MPEKAANSVHVSKGTVNKTLFAEGAEKVEKALADYAVQGVYDLYGKEWWEKGVVSSLGYFINDVPKDDKARRKSIEEDLQKSLAIIETHYVEFVHRGTECNGHFCPVLNRNLVRKAREGRNISAHGKPDRDYTMDFLKILAELVEPIDPSASAELNKLIETAQSLDDDEEYEVHSQEEMNKLRSEISRQAKIIENQKRKLDKKNPEKMSDKDRFEYLRETATKPDMMYQFGLMYFDGIGTEKNDAEAVKWFRAASSFDNADAVFAMSVAYDKGRGIEQSPEKSIECLKKCVELGHAKGIYTLANRYARGKYVGFNENEAIRLYQKAADLDYLPAYPALAELKIAMYKDETTCRTAFNMLKELEDRGNPRVYYVLGKMYEEPWLKEQSYEKAEEYYIKARDAGSVSALGKLARLYEWERVPGSSPDKALSCYKSAIEKGKTSLIPFYTEYLMDIKREQTPPEGFGYASEMYDQGMTRGGTLVGTMYLNGWGVNKDDRKGREFLESAIDKGD